MVRISYWKQRILQLVQADNDAVERAKQILERRINEMGLSEPLVQREGARRIIIELPGVKDPDEAIKRIGKTAVLEFKMTKVKPL